MAFLAASFDSARYIVVKKGTISEKSITVAWAGPFFSLLLLLPVLFYSGIPELNEIFWKAFALKILLAPASIYLFIRALSKEDLSKVIPFLALTPIFTIFSSLLLNREFPSSLGFIGIVLIVVGVYLLNFNSRNKGVLEPFVNIARSEGSLLVLIVSIIWGFTAALDKTAVINSSPIFYATSAAAATALVLTPFVIFANKKEIKYIFGSKRVNLFLLIGLFDGAMLISQMSAVNITLAAYVIAIKRFSIVLSAILAYLFFKEKIRGRILPIVIMFAGLILIAIS